MCKVLYEILRRSYYFSLFVCVYVKLGGTCFYLLYIWYKIRSWTVFFPLSVCLYLFPPTSPFLLPHLAPHLLHPPLSMSLTIKQTKYIQPTIVCYPRQPSIHPPSFCCHLHTPSSLSLPPLPSPLSLLNELSPALSNPL